MYVTYKEYSFDFIVIEGGVVAIYLFLFPPTGDLLKQNNNTN